MYRLDKLKAKRKEESLTIYDMASKLKITPSYYSQIENRKKKLYYDTAFKIAAIFNLKPDDLFYDE